MITFAGRSDHILEFANRFPILWSERDLDLPPMRFLKELDYQLREVRPGWLCSVLGASVIQSEEYPADLLVNNYASLNDNWMFTTDHFGTCLSIGSGSGELREFIENADRNIARHGQAIDSLLFKMLGALNGKALFAQNLRPIQQTWGGLLQAQVYDRAARKWFRSPPWFHLCAFYEGRDLNFRGLHKKCVLHASKPADDYASAVVTSVLEAEGREETIVWPVYSPFLPTSAREPISLMDLETPKMITITEFFDIDGQLRPNHSTYNVDGVAGLKFDFGEGSFGWKIEPNELGQWLRHELLADDTIARLLH